MLDDVRCHTLLRAAYLMAQGSPDPSNQNGAVLVSECLRHTLGRGRNDFTPGVIWTNDLIADRSWKMSHIEHAERAAIFGAGAAGFGTKDSVLVCPWAACTDCARAIVLSGVRLLVVHGDRMAMTPDRWLDSVEAGMRILRAGGVEVQKFQGRIECGPVTVNGEKWEP